jgi:hypothetical protein
MKTITRILAFITLAFGCAFGQTALTQTSLGAAVNGNAVYSGGSPNVDTSVILSSVSSVSAPTAGSGYGTLLYIDAELMAVTSVNSATKVVGVIRGWEGTPVSAHVSGAMVLLAPPNAFYRVDPAGACTAASTAYTPWLNVSNGKQWLCSTLTNTWVPGWGNPGDSAHPIQVTAAVASAAGLVTPSGPLFHMTGTNAITGFNIPVGFSGGSFCAYADAIWTWTAANNIQVAGTVTTGNQAPVCFTYDSSTGKFIPSRVS